MDEEETIVTKLPTGIKGFDLMLEGGIPRGRLLTITGSVGTGKTVLLNEFLYRGITRYAENGVFVTFEEVPSDIRRNVGNFNWDYTRLEKEGKLAFVDFSPILDTTEEISSDYDPSPIILRIKEAIRTTDAQRIVIDSISSLFTQFSNQGMVRRIIYRICYELKELGITGMITAEQPDTGARISGYRIEEFVTDGVIHMRIITGEQQLIREMCVLKMRGVGYRSGPVQFTITSDGLQVFPKIGVSPGVARTDFSKRVKLGIPGLDTALEGGVPVGHIVLVSGNTGSGKTLMCMQFLQEGLQQGETCIFVALEEPAQQIRKTAEAHGWDFSEREQKGDLCFVTTSLIDILADKLLTDIVEAVEKTGAKRIVIDSISSIMSATLNQEKVRQFLLQLAAFLKSKGITCLLSYLMPANFGAEKGQLMSALETNAMRLSSVADGIILLQYVEREQKVEKLLNILKMRGCNHSRDIILYEIERGGLKIGERFRS